jgi:tetratricopeptide (TPR) repeat protein
MSPAMLVLRGVAVYAPQESVEAHFAAGILDKYQLRPGAAEHAGELGFNITEERVFDLLREPRTVDGLAHEAGVTTEFTTRFLYALSLLGIVAIPEEVARGTLSPAPRRIVVDEPDQGKPLTAAEASRIDAEYLACRSQDHFTWLGVPRDASHETLKRAFLRRSENFSPGAFRGRDLGEHRERFESIYLTLAQAYCTLSDPARSASYIAALERRVEERRRAKTESAEAGRFFDADTLLRAGRRLAEDGKHADALRFFEEVLDDQPHHFGALVRLGHSIYMSAPDEFMRAVRHLQEAMAMEPDSGEPYYYLGLIYEARGDPESARHAFAECARRDAGHEGASAGLGRITGKPE